MTCIFKLLKISFKLVLCIDILRSRVPVSTAPSVISHGFHTTPGQTAKKLSTENVTVAQVA